ncbi:hypothetical protein V6N13_139221 [Hibiscus sabdariffa]|uniref:Uncharacterized protein n=2 Tax=Hibiscus sabdariffa TaxID=183260 RepID=A0ABR1ZNH7_9ROSI
MYGIFVELYAIIQATEELDLRNDKAYVMVRDITFSSSEYATQCLNLIAHFETSTSTRKGTIPSIHRISGLPLCYKSSGVPSIIASAASSALTALVAEFYYSHDGFLPYLISLVFCHPFSREDKDEETNFKVVEHGGNRRAWQTP